MSLTVCEPEEETASHLHDEQALEGHVQRVAQSAQFMRADTLKKLLLYLWAHRKEEISEYAVATEALGRRADFDPKTDASVRVQISRLRRKLKDFYESDGAGETPLLHIPMGTHVLTVLDGASPQPAPSTEELEEVSPSNTTRLQSFQSFLVIACVVLLVLCSWLLWDRHKLEGAMARPATPPAKFWTAFFGTDAPAKIILPTPVFFTFPKRSNVHLRDTAVNTFQSWPKSESIVAFSKVGGIPGLDHAYTVTSDTLAGIALARYLDMVGMADRVAFEVSDDSTMNLLEKANVIAMGAHSTLTPFRDYLASMNFSMGTGEAWVDNAHPVAGESQRYTVISEGHQRQIEPEIIAVLPGRAANTKLLILQSRHTIALVEMLTSKVGNSLFEKIHAAHGSPKYFEMVVESETDGDHVIRTWPVALHAYTGNAPTGANVTQ